MSPVLVPLPYTGLTGDLAYTETVVARISLLSPWQKKVIRSFSPPSKLGKGSFDWVLVPGYNSYSPELVMSIYDRPVSISAGQNLRLWYIEDLDDT